MKSSARPFAALLVLALAVAGGCTTFKNLPDIVARGVTHRWAEPSRTAARQLIAEYGLPDDATLNRLTWYGKGPWKRVVVWNQKPIYRSPKDMAVMEQTVDYPLSTAQAAELLSFSGALVIDLQHGELSGRADRESVDFLNLNLANDIVRGRKTAADAKDSYARILSLSVAGKSSPYMKRLLFR